MKKSQLLESDFHNLPLKNFKTNEVAAAFHVELLRLLVKHCTLNPIEFAWAGLKRNVRKYNISFVSYLVLISDYFFNNRTRC